MADEKPKLVECETCSTPDRRRFHLEGPCPRPRRSVHGWHTAQVVGMEKDLVEGRKPVGHVLKEWTW